MPLTREEAKAIIEKVRSENLADNSRHLRGALKNFADQLNSEATHFIWELIQNAEDNEYPPGARAELSLLVEEAADHGSLIALNNEAGFEEKHVRGISSVGDSSKDRTESPDYIGEKGIGFKSVFRVSDNPQIFSNGFQFQFFKPSSPEELGYIVPEWVENVPAQAVDGSTTILLPLKPGVITSVTEQLAKIAPESILFLRKLKRLELGNSNVFSRSDTELSNDSKLVSLQCQAGESRYFIHSKSCPVSPSAADSSRPGITESKITIAFPIQSYRPCTGQIFAFLPTRLNSGLPFLVNADFILNSNREGLLEDRLWNRELRNAIAGTFTEAIMKLLENAEGKQVAHRFVPIATDLMPGADFFATLINPIQSKLQNEKCVLTKDGDCVLPRHAFVAGKLASKVLINAPHASAEVKLLHPDWELDWKKRLEPLGVRHLTFNQLFDACNDAGWLKTRDSEWWETLYLLCSDCKATAEIIGSFPLLPCADGECRPINSGVLFKGENQTIPESLPGPGVVLLDAAVQTRLQSNQPDVWKWLVTVSGLREFSIQSYINDHLLIWMADQTAEQVLEATRFVTTHLDEFVGESLLPMLQRNRRQKLRDKMPWLLADGRILRPEQRAGKSLATPEVLEGDTGWNVLFPALNRHFFVIHDDYCKGLAGEPRETICKLFSICGATAYPSPQARITTGHLDWDAPGWLISLETVGQNESAQRKVAALEHWLKAKGFETAKQHLFVSTSNEANGWTQSSTPSLFSEALKSRPWLRTSAGYVAPQAACLRTLDLQDFFGTLAAYVEADLPPDLLESLGVKTRLTVEVLLARLREMSATTNPDFELVQKIYRRLQDTTFDANVFINERLVFLSFPQNHWRLARELVWTNVGELFDSEFGYVEKTYGNQSQSELRRLFSDKLKVPERPKLEQYAQVWQTLCAATTTDRLVVEKKLRTILPQLASSLDELQNHHWWPTLNQTLKVWTTAGRFVNPASVYMPDSAFAVEIFQDQSASQVPIAYLPPKANKQEFAFLEHMGCRSLLKNIRGNLLQAHGENACEKSKFLTDAAKELIVLMICCEHNFRAHDKDLEKLLRTTEVEVAEITVNYSLADNQAAGIRARPSDAYWDSSNNRLLLRKNIDDETLRDSAAKSIAAQFFGENRSAEMQAPFFKLLMATPTRAKKIKNDHAKWNLTPEQEVWWREQNRESILVEVEAPEQPQPFRQPTSTLSAESQPRTDSVPADITKPVRNAETSSTGQPQVTSGNLQASGERTRTPSERPASVTQATSASESTAEAKPRVPLGQQKPSVNYGKRKTRETRQPRNRRIAGDQQDTNHSKSTAQVQEQQDEKAQIEHAGIECVTRHLKEDEKYNKVTVMPRGNPGFDLLAERQNEVLKVEVKSHKLSATSLVLTKPEWDEYLNCQKTNQAWELWHVENALSANPVITRYNNIPVSAIMPRQYQLNLAECSHSKNTDK